MIRNWTDQQRRAIELRSGCAALSAAAGSGKTAVLVARVLGLITDRDRPVDIDRLLVVTFTEAAAREMRTRIAASLAELAAGGCERSRRQLALTNHAQISTIHSFCLSVIRQHSTELGIDPGFSVMDQLEAALMRRDAAADVVGRRLARGDPGWLSVVDRGLESLLERTYEQSRSQSDPEDWLERAKSAYREAYEDPGGSQWACELVRAAEVEVQAARRDLLRARQEASSDGGPSQYLPVLDQDLAMVQELLAVPEWEAWQRAWIGLEFGRLPGSRGGDPELRERAKDCRDRAKKRLESAGLPFTMPLDELRSDLRAAGEQVVELCDLVWRFGRQYRGMKRRQGKCDFGDLERLCLDILERPGPDGQRPGPAAKRVRARYDYVLVDEYQDTNPVQDRILDLVQSDNLFVVGDVRQSVYRFRLAEPGIFRSRVEACRSGQGTAIELDHNFRSRAGIIGAVNFLYRQLGDQTWARDLVAGASFAPLEGGDPPVELVVLDRHPTDDDRDLVSLEREALAASQRIGGWMSDRVLICDRESGEMRPIQYRDIAVLLRARRFRSEAVAAILGRMGIPARADSETGYFASREVVQFRALLSVMTNPRQDFPLAGVLREFGRFSADDLVRISGRRSLYDGVVAAAGGDDVPGLCCREFLAWLGQWRERASRISPARFVSSLLRDTGYYDRVGGLPGGETRRANLEALVDLARRYERSGGTGVDGLVRFLRRLEDAGQDLGPAPSTGDGDDAVRVLTIHRSKGLEYPAVIVLDLGRRLRSHPSTPEVDLDRDLGIGAQRVCAVRGSISPTLASWAVAARRAAEERKEELRVLYVALTRARERLVLIGSTAEPQRAESRWREAGDIPDWPLGQSHLLSAASYLDLMAPAILRHGSVDGKGPNEIRDWPCQFRLAIGEVPEDETGARPPQFPDRESVDLPWLDWEPPDTGWDRAAAKVGASEYKRVYDPGHEQSGDWLAASRGEAWSEPEWMRPDTPRDRGIAIHRFLQHVDLSRRLDADGISAEVERLVAGGYLLSRQSELLDQGQLVRLFAGEVGLRLQADPGRVIRETPFSMSVPAVDVWPGIAPGGPPVLVQGVIDCLVAADEGLLLFDFKARTPVRDRSVREAEHREQLMVYREAAVRMFDKPVTAAVVYVDSGEVVRLAGD